MFESITQIDASSDTSFDDYVRAVKELQLPILEILTKVFPLFRNVKAKRAAFLFCIHNQTIKASSLQPILNALSAAFPHHAEIVDELSAEIKQVVRNTRPSSMPAMTTRNRKDLLSSASASSSSSFDNMYTTVDDSSLFLLPTVVVAPPPPPLSLPAPTVGRKKSPERTVSPLLFRYRTTEKSPEPMIYLSYCALRERVQKHEHLEELWIGHYERHLFPVETEYDAAFGRSKEVFDALPLFQQTAFKKKAGLF